MIKQVLSPFVDLLPDQMRFPGVIASVLLLAACFTTGMIVQTRAGQGAGILPNLPHQGIKADCTTMHQ